MLDPRHRKKIQKLWIRPLREHLERTREPGRPYALPPELVAAMGNALDADDEGRLSDFVSREFGDSLDSSMVDTWRARIEAATISGRAERALRERNRLGKGSSQTTKNPGDVGITFDLLTGELSSGSSQVAPDTAAQLKQFVDAHAVLDKLRRDQEKHDADLVWRERDTDTWLAEVEKKLADEVVNVMLEKLFDILREHWQTPDDYEMLASDLAAEGLNYQEQQGIAEGFAIAAGMRVYEESVEYLRDTFAPHLRETLRDSLQVRVRNVRSRR